MPGRRDVKSISLFYNNLIQSGGRVPVGFCSNNTVKVSSNNAHYLCIVIITIDLIKKNIYIYIMDMLVLYHLLVFDIVL